MRLRRPNFFPFPNSFYCLLLLGNTNPRSTVGTITEIHDYLRVLYARVGKGYCPNCDSVIAAQTMDQVIGSIYRAAEGQLVHILAPVVRG